nr:MAG TPA: hypothetical protein [Caudoviricetes sp.]
MPRHAPERARNGSPIGCKTGRHDHAVTHVFVDDLDGHRGCEDPRFSVPALPLCAMRHQRGKRRADLKRFAHLRKPFLRIFLLICVNHLSRRTGFFVPSGGCLQTDRVDFFGVDDAEFDGADHRLPCSAVSGEVEIAAAVQFLERGDVLILADLACGEETDQSFVHDVLHEPAVEVAVGIIDDDVDDLVEFCGVVGGDAGVPGQERPHGLVELMLLRNRIGSFDVACGFVGFHDGRQDAFVGRVLVNLDVLEREVLVVESLDGAPAEAGDNSVGDCCGIVGDIVLDHRADGVPAHVAPADESLQHGVLAFPFVPAVDGLVVLCVADGFGDLDELCGISRIERAPEVFDESRGVDGEEASGGEDSCEGECDFVFHNDLSFWAVARFLVVPFSGYFAFISV